MANDAERIAPYQLKPGNTAQLQHGFYSKRRWPLDEEEEAELEGLLSLSHVIAPDAAAAEEIVRSRSLISRMDASLASRPLETRAGGLGS